MTWEQIGLTAKCIHMHKHKMIKSVMDPIAAGLGSKQAKKDLAKQRKKLNKKVDKAKLTPEEKDAKLYSSIRMAGLRIL
jgi:hypothetical protein